MRTAETIGVEAMFYGDVEGGVQIYCQQCSYVFVDNSQPDQACICPHCETELFYRPWFVW